MAPKRKPGSETSQAPTTITTSRGTRSSARTAARATRSATLRGDASLNPPVSDLEPRSRKKTKTTSDAGVSSSYAAGASSSYASGASYSVAGKTVIIEYCGQCDPFKKKAAQIKKGLEKAVCGVNVVLNPEPPRKGCFEIREKGGDVFESLLDMESPFEPLKALDVKKVVSDVVEKIK